MPRATAPFPFTIREYGRLLVLRGQVRDGLRSEFFLLFRNSGKVPGLSEELWADIRRILAVPAPRPSSRGFDWLALASLFDGFMQCLEGPHGPRATF